MGYIFKELCTHRVYFSYLIFFWCNTSALSTWQLSFHTQVVCHFWGCCCRYDFPLGRNLQAHVDPAEWEQGATGL